MVLDEDDEADDDDDGGERKIARGEDDDRTRRAISCSFVRVTGVFPLADDDEVRILCRVLFSLIIRIESSRLLFRFVSKVVNG